jgi:hypothetical protein
MQEPYQPILPALVGSQIASVVFVRSYVQLVFEPTRGAPETGFLTGPSRGCGGTLSAYVLPELQTGGGRLLVPGDPGYRNALVDLIDQVVSQSVEETNRLRVVFDSGTAVTVSLEAGALTDGMVESAMVQLDDGARSWMVWRPGDQPG